MVTVVTMVTVTAVVTVAAVVTVGRVVRVVNMRPLQVCTASTGAGWAEEMTFL